jgi:hypothetical protein
MDNLSSGPEIRITYIGMCSARVPAQAHVYIPRSTLELETTNHQSGVLNFMIHGHVDNCPDFVPIPQGPSPQKLTGRTLRPIGLPKIGDPQS